MPDMMHDAAAQSITLWHDAKCCGMKRNAAVQRTRLWHDAQCHGTKNNAMEQRTMPQLEEQCHSIPLHGKKCHCTMHNAAANTVARCAMQLHAVAAGRMMAAMATSTAMQWQCQR